MTPRLPDLDGCFEGVIPSVIATSTADGTPNISYLSHVVMVDENRVALSNQFFAKTSANIRANPNVLLMLVDGHTGMQYQLQIRFEKSVDKGPVFDRIAVDLEASSAQVGMEGVMRLKSADIFRVLHIREIPTAYDYPEKVSRPPVNIRAAATVTNAMDMAMDVGSVIDVMLAGMQSEMGFSNAMVLLADPLRDYLVTVGSMGYGDLGIGSEVSRDQGLIGSAATHARPIKVSDMSRIQRFGAAIAERGPEENTSRSIALPKLVGAMSQLAVPILSRGRMHGVIFAESTERLAFQDSHIAALEILARQLAAALMLADMDVDSTSESAPVQQIPLGDAIQIAHHAYDDSIFIKGEYVIKGVAGRLLRYLLDRYLREGRSEFSNREIRLSETLRLPDIKDNLETRILLLQRRLDEKQLPIRIVRSGRGKISLDIDGHPVIQTLT